MSIFTSALLPHHQPQNGSIPIVVEPTSCHEELPFDTNDDEISTDQKFTALRQVVCRRKKIESFGGR